MKRLDKKILKKHFIFSIDQSIEGRETRGVGDCRSFTCMTELERRERERN